MSFICASVIFSPVGYLFSSRTARTSSPVFVVTAPMVVMMTS
jgi:hypothetical protein